MVPFLTTLASALLASALAGGDRRPERTLRDASPAACRPSGCNGEVCADHPGMASICLHRPEHACYAKARCERQADGECGWTQTPELAKCLERARGRRSDGEKERSP